MEEEIESVIAVIEELENDNTIPKNVKSKLNKITGILKENAETSIKVNKALHELEEIEDDINLQAFARTQLWNIESMLEKL